jgi:hypothetical protein
MQYVSQNFATWAPVMTLVLTVRKDVYVFSLIGVEFITLTA